MAYLAPSILSADILKLEKQVETVVRNGADIIHVDVMDGHFVPNITFGPFIVKALKQICDLPLDVHLMIDHPERYIESFAEAGARYITVHQEACLHLDRTLHQIKEAGCLAGVSLNPATPVNMLEHLLNDIDLVLVMSVNPGFGGQKFIPYSTEKISRLAEMRMQQKASFLIEVDGGINEQTAVTVLRSGADILVAGNAVFGQDNIGEACRHLKGIITGGARTA